jgi:TonB-linked SusC/RagA family outer membrane protein
MKRSLLFLFRMSTFWQLFSLMKLMAITALVVLLATGKTFAQQEEQDKDNNSKTKPVKEWFSLIEKKTGYRFFFSDDLPDLDKEIDLKTRIRDKDIDTVLTELKQETDYEFKKLENKLIVVIPLGRVPQPITVHGKVTSTDEPQGLPGINVYVKGSTLGTVTDINGEYTLKVPDKYDVLVFSSIGYDKKEVPVNGREKIDVVMETGAHNLDEVVVTALNIKRDKTSLGYSVTQVDSKEIATVKQNNPINSLTGKVAGLQISSSPSGVDGSSRVVLRGISSLSGNNRPLIVVDGVPVGGGTYGGPTEWGGTDKGDALSDINPDDVESISVLKGAGAAAVYGSQGANGVILITTKKGKKRQGIGITVNSNLMVNTPMVLPDLQNEYGQGAFGRYPTDEYNGLPVTGGMAAIKNTEPWIWSWGSKMDGSEKEDWLGNMTPYNPQPNFFSEFYRTGIVAINTLALNGGNDKTTYRASFTQNNSKGMNPTNKMSKQTFNIHGSSDLGEYVNVTAKVTYIHTSVQNRPYLAEDPANAGWTMGALPRNVVLSTLKDHYQDSEGREQWAWDITAGNPYWALEYKKNFDVRDRLQGLMVLNFDITKRLKLMLRSGLDLNSADYKEYLGEGGLSLGYNVLGSMSHSQNTSYFVNSDFLLTYSVPTGENISVNVNLGGQHRYATWRSISQSGTDWKIKNFYHMSNLNNYATGEGYGEKEALSIYALGDVSYKNFVYLDFTFRNDWSSTLPVENNAYQFYSANMSFLFSNAFNISSDFFSKGKIRASIARVGNDTGPYQTYNYYSVYQTTYPYPMGGMSGELTFQDFKPEITNSWEVGTNLSFFNNRLDLDFTYYDGKTHNQIMSVELAPSTGYSTQKVNAGEVRNYGIEALISGKIIAHKDFTYNASLNFSKNKNNVISLSNNADSRVLLEAVSGFARVELHAGEPFGSIYGYDYLRNEKGEKIVDKNGMPQQGEYKKLGDINPDWVGGLSNTFSYKNLNLRFLIDFQIGGEYYSESRLYHDLFGTSKKSLEGREEWYSTHTGPLYGKPLPGTFPDGYIEDGVKPDGAVNDIPVQPMIRMVNTIWFEKVVSDYIMDATNVRLRELSLGYSLPQRWMDKSFFTRVNLSFVARNLFFFYNASGDYDPESGFNSGSIGNAFELNPMPSARSFGFNLTVDF